MARRLKFWGWGYEDQQPTPSRRSPRLPARAAPRLPPADVERAGRLEESSCRRPAIQPPRLARAHLLDRPTSAPRTPTARPIATWSRASEATSTTRPTSSRSPATRRTSSACSTGARRRARRRSRSAAARAWSAASRRRRDASRRVSIDLGALDRVLEVDEVSRAARIQAGAARPGARGAAAPARPHAAPLPAVVRVLDARRLDRDARGRPLRDARTRTSTTSSSRSAWSRRRRLESRRLPGSGAGPEPRPPVPRLGGHARRHHRSVDAGAGRARASGRRRA